MTEVGKDITEEKLFSGGRMVMTHYRSVFDPGFMKMFYVVLPGDLRSQFVSGSQEETAKTFSLLSTGWASCGGKI